MQCRKMRLTLLLAALILQFAVTSESPVHRLEGRGSIILERLRRLQKEVVSVAAPVCPDPGTPTNGHKKPHEGESYEVGEEAVFVCRTDYVLEGQSLITCIQNSDGTASWDHPAPQCNIGEESAAKLCSSCKKAVVTLAQAGVLEPA